MSSENSYSSPSKAASVGGLFHFSFRKIKIKKRELRRALFEYSGEFLAKIIHIIAQLHDRNHALYLIVYFVAASQGGGGKLGPFTWTGTIPINRPNWDCSKSAGCYGPLAPSERPFKRYYPLTAPSFGTPVPDGAFSFSGLFWISASGLIRPVPWPGLVPFHHLLR